MRWNGGRIRERNAESVTVRQLGCPEGTVSSRLARGQERLRRQLDSRGAAQRTPT
jgi:hypothetical protein